MVDRVRYFTNGTSKQDIGGLMLENVVWNVRRFCPPISPIFPIVLPHFRLYEVVSLHMCFLPFKYRKILEMVLELMELCELMGAGIRAGC